MLQYMGGLYKVNRDMLCFPFFVSGRKLDLLPQDPQASAETSFTYPLTDTGCSLLENV